MKKAFLAALATVMILGAGYAVAESQVETAPATAEVGKLAPNFTATDTKGTEQKLSSYAGKTVVLEWTNPECPYVKKHYGSNNMQNLQKAATADGVIWLRINSGAAGKQGHQTPAEFDATATDVTANIIDESGAIGKLYGAKTTPHMYVVNSGGTLVYAGAIDDNDSSDPADIATSKNYVKTVLDDLKAGRVASIDQTKPYGCGVKYAD